MTHDPTVAELARLLVKLWAVDTDADAAKIQTAGVELADLIQEFLQDTFPI